MLKPYLYWMRVFVLLFSLCLFDQTLKCERFHWFLFCSLFAIDFVSLFLRNCLLHNDFYRAPVILHKSPKVCEKCLFCLSQKLEKLTFFVWILGFHLKLTVFHGNRRGFFWFFEIFSKKMTKICANLLSKSPIFSVSWVFFFLTLHDLIDSSIKSTLRITRSINRTWNPVQIEWIHIWKQHSPVYTLESTN